MIMIQGSKYNKKKKAHSVYEIEDKGIINYWAKNIRQDLPEKLASELQLERRVEICKADKELTLQLASR